MSLFTTPPDEINLQRMQELINNQVYENRHLEYKCSLPGNTDTEKKEFFADVTAMANSCGGDIDYCIKKSKGISFLKHAFYGYNTIGKVIITKKCLTINEYNKPLI